MAQSFLHSNTTHTHQPMDKKNIHITPAPDGGWQGKREGATRPSFQTDKKKEAVDKGREQCKKDKCELFIHGKDGRIQSRDNCGKEPKSSEG